MQEQLNEQECLEKINQTLFFSKHSISMASNLVYPGSQKISGHIPFQNCTIHTIAELLFTMKKGCPF